MASSYAVKRSKGSKIIYSVSSVFVLYRYIALLEDAVLNNNKCLIFICTLVLILFFLVVYMNRIFLFDSCFVIVCAPVLLIVKYDRVSIMEKTSFTNIKYNYHINSDENPICFSIADKVYSFSTNNNKELMKTLNKSKTGTVSE